MINIDTRLLKDLNENEYWLISHLAKRLNVKHECWPSNKVLCKETGWHIEKLQKVKKSLIDKNLLSVIERNNNKGGQSSNLYKITTKLIGVYIEADYFDFEEETHSGKNDMGVLDFGDMAHAGKTDNKVLSSEVLTNEEIYVFSKKVINVLNQSKKSLGIRGSCVWTEARAKSINSRLKEGNFTEDQILAMVRHRCGVWKNTDWERYLTPETLFRPTKFTGYVEQSLAQPSKGWEHEQVERNSEDDKSGLPANHTW